MADLLMERKRWFGFFPEGTLEFLVITRVLALILAGTLIIVPTSQRPAVLIALSAVIWLDYALLIWWLVHLANDLEIVFGPSAARLEGASGTMLSYASAPPGASGTRPVTWRDGFFLLVPSLLALLVLAPWPQFLVRKEAMRSQMLMIVIPVLIIAYLASLPLVYRCTKQIGLPRGPWSILLFVPVAHWFALHRFLRPLHARVRDRALQQKLPVSSETGAGGAATASDFLWMISAVFWMLWAVLALSGRTGGAALALVQAASVGLGGVFAITEVAALEYLQRRFVALVRRVEPTRLDEPGLRGSEA